MPPLFTVLLPITRPPFMLPFAIESVLAQSVLEFELFIICDGAPPDTVACARDFARRDTRVKVFPFPKGQRHGEAHRHTVLEGAAGRYVAQIADDDLWFPDHLAELEILLSKSDFGNLLHVFLQPDGTGVVDIARRYRSAGNAPAYAYREVQPIRPECCWVSLGGLPPPA